MKQWNDRPKEVANLLNPAFCGRILHAVIKNYNDVSSKAMPFPLVYLILPLILHTPTRKTISSRTMLLPWIRNNPSLLIDFAKRCRGLVPITNEALEMLLQVDFLRINAEGELEIPNESAGLSRGRFADSEVRECLAKSISVAKWFATAGTVETIFIELGVRP